jgi:hypothetical protein
VALLRTARQNRPQYGGLSPKVLFDRCGAIVEHVMERMRWKVDAIIADVIGDIVLVFVIASLLGVIARKWGGCPVTSPAICSRAMRFLI